MNGLTSPNGFHYKTKTLDAGFEIEKEKVCGKYQQMVISEGFHKLYHPKFGIFTISEAAWSTNSVWGQGGREEVQETNLTKPSRHFSESINNYK